MKKIIGMAMQSSVVVGDPQSNPRNFEELGEMLIKAAKLNQKRGGDSLSCTFTTESGASMRITEGEGLFFESLW